MSKKDEIKVKWDWKIFWIIILILALFIVSYDLVELEDSYNELLLNVTRMAGEFDSNFDCYERGTKECYDVGSVDCYVKGNVGKAEDKLEEFLRNNDCYERGTVQCYDKRSYCYDTPQITTTCESGYSLVCVQN